MLTSLKNPLVKQIRKLHQSKSRRQQGVFLLEGTHLLQEAKAVDWPLEVVCMTPDWQQKHPSLWEDLQVRCETVIPAVLAAMATTVNPDGVMAVAKSQLHSLPTLSAQGVGLVLETLQDPGNLGTLIRTGVATGVEVLLMSTDCVDPENPKVLRASAGAWFHLPRQICPDLAGTLRQYQQQGFQLMATCPTASRCYWDLDLTKPTLILIGNEGAGLSPALSELADQTVQIPLLGGVESLNAAIAAAVILYEVRRQRRNPEAFTV
ncbi:RNA methyltransferase [Synechococcales cyanobacterium C]|uniref:RNA methyltransferase n=1 Tax=Petrachloros mirabilis ULC683 TaxID=2781853 RepID=A0A8K2ACM9_9CYAN|nr:RNA methyltransferase [Petrachloros mirabilis]NCJ05584.1 RNA methyltransferase [Petrachloros mirabilis ULC683]